MFEKSAVKIFAFSFLIMTIGHCSILRSCNDSVNFMQLCIAPEVKNYNPSYNDCRYNKNVPTEFQTVLSVFQLADIDEIKATLTINMIFGVIWNDTRLSLNQPLNEKQEAWHEVTDEEVENIHVPQMTFNNLEGLQRLPGWGPIDRDYFWFQRPHNFQFQQPIRVKLFCTFEFGSYPFDNHFCDMTFGSKSTMSPTTIYLPPIILDENENMIETHINKVNQSKFPFEIHLEILAPYNRTNLGLPYPFSGIRIHMQRDELGLLYGGFYGPTGLFALLSLTSYTINPEVVPGRLGVLVTLYLIASNVYGSVKGPTNRGFSYIELWMIGIQIPILAAIVEYSVILVLKKHHLKHKDKVHSPHQDRGMEIDKLAIEMDKWAFVVSLIYIVGFGCVYYGMAMRELTKNSV